MKDSETKLSQLYWEKYSRIDLHYGSNTEILKVLSSTYKAQYDQILTLEAKIEVLDRIYVMIESNDPNTVSMVFIESEWNILKSQLSQIKTDLKL